MAKNKEDKAAQGARAAAAARQEARDNAIATIEKEFGEGSIMLGPKVVNVDVISTGCLGVDIALGVGGLPRGRVVEVYGPESSGKTTLALQVIASAQRAGGTAAFLDAEHALDPKYAAALGVDMDKLLLSQPDYGEQALRILETLVASGALDVVVVDSVAALVPKDELDGNVGDSFIGLHARLMSQALRKLNGVAFKTNTVVIFINQIREKIGVRFGSPETTTGGRALKFYASCRIDIRRIGGVKASGAAAAEDDGGASNIGNRVRVKIVKNKVAPPFKTAEFDIMFGLGVSRGGCVVDLGEKLGLITKKGSMYTVGDQRFNGRPKTIEWLEANSDILVEYERNILEASLAKPEEAPPAEGDVVEEVMAEEAAVEESTET